MKRIGIYAGSFNPFHVGHADVLHQALNTFDEVIVALGRNPEKDGNTKEPFPIGHAVLKTAKVDQFSGLLTDYLSEVELANEEAEVYLIRGLRNGDDLQMEQNQLQFIREMYPSVKPVFFLGAKEFEHISSTALRALKKVSEKEYYKYVFRPPAPVDGKMFGGGFKHIDIATDEEFNRFYKK